MACGGVCVIDNEAADDDNEDKLVVPVDTCCGVECTLVPLSDAFADCLTLGRLVADVEQVTCGVAAVPFDVLVLGNVLEFDLTVELTPLDGVP